MIQKIKKNIKDFFKNPKEVISFFLPIVIMLILLIIQLLFQREVQLI